MWWQVELAANVTICAAYFCIAAVIAVPLVRLGQLGQNRLGTATAAIFFSCAVGHGLHGVHAYLEASGTTTVHTMGTWWLATAHVITAVIGVYYLTLRRFYGRLLTPAPLFHDLTEQARLRTLEAFESEVRARTAAEGDRDRYAHMLHSINQNSKALIYVKDLEGRYLMVNAAFVDVFGRREADILGLTDDDLDPLLAGRWRAADLEARNGSYRVEESMKGPEGPRYFDSIKFPLADGRGVLYATCGISMEVTESKRFNVELAQARDAAIAATAAKSAFLATMSHEIRTPLNAVVGLTDLLLDTRLDEQQVEMLDTVRSSGDSLMAVINDVLDFSKIEAGELRLAAEPFHLRHIMEGVLDLVATAAAAKNLDLVCYVDDSCPTTVVGDAPHLRQILINLLSNGVKFTPEGDVLLTVVAKPLGEDFIELTCTIADTGIGISPEGLKKLFRSFSQVDDSSQRAYGGTGLGLAISKRLAQAMGGDVVVTSVVGTGSTFVVTVVVEPCDTAEGEVVVDSDTTLAGVSVLLVDDNATNLRILEMQLAGADMVVTTAASPEDALDLVSEGSSYAIAVLDYAMPGSNGVQLSAALRELPGASAGSPHILLSSTSARPPTLEASFAAVLVKPVKLDLLLDALRAALTRRGDTSGARQDKGGGLRSNRRPLKVLLAEDNQVNQRVAQLMLDKLGHQVSIVGNGQAAVGAVVEENFDVVLMDLQMPIMDGLQATRIIRAQLPAADQPHIIAMTASALIDDQKACFDAGMESCLTKPVRAQELKDMLDRVSATIHQPDPQD
jgi:signal transduction histidine kinase/DNA-binding response OmpR family regulator